MNRLYRPSDLLQFLEEIGAAPNRRLSQNFLIDGNILRKTVEAAALEPGQCVLEIGPGPGALTQLLLETGAHVVAVEKDPLFASHLGRLAPDPATHSLKVICNDVREVKFPEILPLKTGEKAKVVANLPYHLTSPILGQLLDANTLFSKIVVMVQKEVAERMVAVEKQEGYSSLSVFLRFYSTPRLAFLVSSHCFFPKPKVDSAVVVLDLHPELPKVDPKAFFDWIHQLFSQRRKMLRGRILREGSQADPVALLAEVGVSAEARPEEVSLKQFLNLYSLIQ